MKSLCVAVLLLLLVLPARARVMRIPIEDMPSQADFVAFVTVVDSMPRWDERGLMIYTDYAVLVDEAILGEPDSLLIMSFAGGTVDGETIHVSDTPRLEVNKKYLIFGLENEKSFAPVVGHEQGLFRVLEDKPSGKEYIVDYYGHLLEKLDSGKIIRGPLVDPDVTDRLVLKKLPEAKKASLPAPVVRDARGKIVPQEGATVAPRRKRESGAPVEKKDFVDFITGKAKVAKK